MKKDSDADEREMRRTAGKLDEATSPQKINELVKARMAIVNSAINHLDAATIEKLDSMTDMEIMKAVLSPTNQV